MKTPHTPGKWRVQADPLLPKRHPYHDSRYITTDHDLETWRSPMAEGHGDDMCGFAKGDGSAAIICTMRDGKHQKANAELIARAPELLEALNIANAALPSLLAQRDALRDALKLAATWAEEQRTIEHNKSDNELNQRLLDHVCEMARAALTLCQEAGK